MYKNGKQNIDRYRWCMLVRMVGEGPSVCGAVNKKKLHSNNYYTTHTLGKTCCSSEEGNSRRIHRVQASNKQSFCDTSYYGNNSWDTLEMTRRLKSITISRFNVTLSTITKEIQLSNEQKLFLVLTNIGYTVRIHMYRSAAWFS